jgi:hypothetical protein
LGRSPHWGHGLGGFGSPVTALVPEGIQVSVPPLTAETETWARPETAALLRIPRPGNCPGRDPSHAKLSHTAATPHAPEEFLGRTDITTRKSRQFHPSAEAVARLDIRSQDAAGTQLAAATRIKTRLQTDGLLKLGRRVPRDLRSGPSSSALGEGVDV